MKKRRYLLLLTMLLMLAVYISPQAAISLDLGKTAINNSKSEVARFKSKEDAYYTVSITGINYVTKPTAPVRPVSSQYEDWDDYEDALDEYDDEMYDYEDELEDYEEELILYRGIYDGYEEWDTEQSLTTMPKKLSFKVKVSKGDQYAVRFGESVASYNITVKKQKKTAAPKLKVSKKISMVVGFQKTIKASITDSYRYKMPKITWKTTNNQIAVVNKKGVVTGIQPGKCKVTAKISKRKYTINVTVKENTYSDGDYYDISDFDYREPGIVIRNYAYQGNTLVLTCEVFNNYTYRMTKFDWLKIRIYNPDNGKNYFYRLFNNVPCSVPAFGTKIITLTIPDCKIINLVDTPWRYEYEYYYSYAYR